MTKLECSRREKQTDKEPDTGVGGKGEGARGVGGDKVEKRLKRGSDQDRPKAEIDNNKKGKITAFMKQKGRNNKLLAQEDIDKKESVSQVLQDKAGFGRTGR